MYVRVYALPSTSLYLSSLFEQVLCNSTRNSLTVRPTSYFFPPHSGPYPGGRKAKETYFVIRKLTQTPAVPYTDNRWESYQNFPVHRDVAETHGDEFCGFRRVEVGPRDDDSDVCGGKLERCLVWLMVLLFCHFYMSLNEILGCFFRI